MWGCVATFQGMMGFGSVVWVLDVGCWRWEAVCGAVCGGGGSLVSCVVSSSAEVKRRRRSRSRSCPMLRYTIAVRNIQVVAHFEEQNFPSHHTPSLFSIELKMASQKV